MRILKQFLPGALCALTVLTGGCKEEGRDVLFEEDGTWALIQHDIDGGGLEPTSTAQANKFLLRFDMEAGVVAAASCIDSMDRTDLTKALCDIEGKFECRCFDYTYVQSTMTWTERAREGETLAEPKTTTVTVQDYPGFTSAYLFKPLPEGLYNSDGASTTYLLQTRGNSLFDKTGCLDACGITPPVDK